jgi:putative ABC transport system permease protein
MMIARASTRRHEVGLRLAVGATRGRVLRQMLIESALLTTLGGAAGLVVATITLQLLGAYQLPGGIDINTLDLSLNGWTLVATAGLSLLTGLLCGAVPAWHGSRTDPITTLREHTGSITPSSDARGALVGVQIAISLVLLTGSALFLRGLIRALEMPDGAQPGWSDDGLGEPRPCPLRGPASACLLCGRARAGAIVAGRQRDGLGDDDPQ